MQTIIIDSNDSKTINDSWILKTNVSKVNNILWDDLIYPDDGKMTCAGKKLAQINKTLYQYANTGRYHWRFANYNDDERNLAMYNYFKEGIRQILKTKAAKKVLAKHNLIVEFKD